MASAFSHTVVALTLGRLKERGGAMPPCFWILPVFCASMPDLDVIGVHMVGRSRSS